VDEMRGHKTHGELRYAYDTLIEETDNKRSVWKHNWRKILKLDLNML